MVEDELPHSAGEAHPTLSWEASGKIWSCDDVALFYRLYSVSPLCKPIGSPFLDIPTNQERNFNLFAAPQTEFIAEGGNFVQVVGNPHLYLQLFKVCFLEAWFEAFEPNPFSKCYWHQCGLLVWVPNFTSNHPFPMPNQPPDGRPPLAKKEPPAVRG